MEGRILLALLDLQVALGELQASITDVDQAIRKLMAVQIEALESKTGAVSGIAGEGTEHKKDPPKHMESIESSTSQ